MKYLQEGRIRTVRFAMKTRVCASRRSVIHMALAIFENHSINLRTILILNLLEQCQGDVKRT
jgi:hypothetical protein